MNLTPWFPGNIKPIHTGVYQRNYGKSQIKELEDITYCLWDGENWKVWGFTVEDASLEVWKSSMQNLPWRGILK